MGTVSIDGTKIDANASKLRSVGYDRAKELRAKLAADIAGLTAKAEAADAHDSDPQALPAEIARPSKPSKRSTTPNGAAADARPNRPTTNRRRSAKATSPIQTAH